MMNLRNFILLAVCVVACYSVCVPDPLPSESDQLIVGNLKPLNTTSDSVVQLIHFLNEFKYNASGANDNLMIVTCVKSVRSQLVAGMRYEFNVLLQKTKCLKKEVEYSSLSVPNLFKDSCPLDANANEVPAKFSIWVKPWLNFVQVRDITNNENTEEPSLIDN